jgi:hypothetical protein
MTDIADADMRFISHVYKENGWWHAAVTFEGERRYIGALGSETQAQRVVARWRRVLLCEDAPRQPRQRGECGKPRAPT